VVDALQSDGSALSVLKKQEGEVVAKAILVKILSNLISFFNVGKSMNDAQVAQTVELILDDYYYLKLEDFKVCFDGMKKGKYLGGTNGKLFDRLDGQIILQGIAEYAEERSTEGARINEEKHKQTKTDDKGETYLVMVGELYMRVDGKKVSDVTTKELATPLPYDEALSVKMRLIDEGYTQVKMLFNKPDIGLIEYISQENPELLDHQTQREIKNKEYNQKRSAILDNNDLTDFERTNALRAIANLKPYTEAEYEAELLRAAESFKRVKTKITEELTPPKK
jgi:hypothetical protein